MVVLLMSTCSAEPRSLYLPLSHQSWQQGFPWPPPPSATRPVSFLSMDPRRVLNFLVCSALHLLEDHVDIHFLTWGTRNQNSTQFLIKFFSLNFSLNLPLDLKCMHKLEEEWFGRVKERLEDVLPKWSTILFKILERGL